MTINRIRLGINIDHIATLKTNRKTTYPSLVEAVKIAESSGADLITVHLREDRRHIQDQDLLDIRSVAKRLNLEMALTEEMLGICISTKPNFCCVVPEKRNELTTEGGLDIKSMSPSKFLFLQNAIKEMRVNNIETSLFIDPELDQINLTIKSGARCIELHTGSYANAANEQEKKYELDRIISAAEYAKKNDLKIHAGHGLNLSNLADICKIACIEELNIGHAVIADSVFKGLETSIKDFRRLIDND